MNERRLPMLRREFEARFGRPAEIGARVAGRVDLKLNPRAWLRRRR